MKIGVISDTHLKEVSQQLIDMYDQYFSGVDMIVHAGDLVSMEIVDFLGQKPLRVVQGNMDNRDIRERFPKKEVIVADGFRLGLIHGWGSPFGMERRIRSQFNDVDAIIFGHTHRSTNRRDKGVLFFNPGTASGVAVSGSRSIGILDLEEEIRGSIIVL